MKNAGVVIVIVTLLLLFVILFKRKKQSLHDNFFSDAEIVKDFDEAPVPTAVPNSMMNAQVDSGTGNTECEQGGYMAFTFPNPTPNPITLNIVDPQQYYQQLNDYYSSAGNQTSSYSLGANLSTALIANGYIYSVHSLSSGFSSKVSVFDPVTNLNILDIPLLRDSDAVSAADTIIYNQLLIIPGSSIAIASELSIIDVNPNSPTYNQLLTNVLLGVSIVSSSIAVFGNNIYVVFNGGAGHGLKKIDLTTFTVTTINLTPSSVTCIYPNYRRGQTSDQYIYLFQAGPAGFVVFDTVTDTIVTGGAIAGGALSATSVNNNLYVGQNNGGIAILNMGSNTVTSIIPTGVDDIEASVYNGYNTLYAASGTDSVIAINTVSNTVVATIDVSAYITLGSNSFLLTGTSLYAGGTNTSGIIVQINTDESSATWNTISSTISTGIASPLQLPIVAIGDDNFNVYFVASASGSLTNTLVTYPVNVLTDQIGINLNNMANMQANPGMICGIFYRSLTVAQMSNVFSIDYNNAFGETSTYKLVPFTYKDTMSVLNQIYVSKFYQPIIINNNLNLYHVINPGENVYIKIYVKEYISNVEMLKTGNISVSTTNSTSIHNQGDVDQEDDEDEEQQEDEDWMTIEEVENEEWAAIHIECEE